MKVDDLHTQERVLETSKQIMLEYGLKGVNMDKLAKESGVAKATLYKIIGSKQELISKIAIDFFAETFGHLFESILNKNSYQNFSKIDIEHLASLAIGKMRVIQKQVFLEYPTIEKQFSNYMEGYKNQFIEKFHLLQEKNEIIQDVTPENIYRFFRIIFMQMVTSSYSDSEVKIQLIEMYYVFFRGLKA